MKIAYIGIDILIEALNALLAEGCEVVEIFTCKTDNKTEFNTAVTAKAESLGVPLKLEPIDSKDLRRLEQKGVEAVICAGYYHKVPTDTDIPLINIHPALLPIGRGAWPMPLTILRGLRYSGVTFHKMASDFDKGDILLQDSFELSPREDLESFMCKVSGLIRKNIPTLISDLKRLWSLATPQEKGEYWRMPEESDYTVGPHMSDGDIDRILRAFYGYECIYDDGKKRYEIIRARLKDSIGVGECGFRVDSGKYVVAQTVTEL